jgi:hypothetical protein
MFAQWRWRGKADESAQSTWCASSRRQSGSGGASRLDGISAQELRVIGIRMADEATAAPSKGYLYACQRAELLGLPTPSEAEWLASDEYQREAAEEEEAEAHDDAVAQVTSSRARALPGVRRRRLSRTDGDSVAGLGWGGGYKLSVRGLFKCRVVLWGPTPDFSSALSLPIEGAFDLQRFLIPGLIAIAA